jgi:hypothetical protein
MKRLRVTALGLVVGLCVLAAAPAVYAGDGLQPPIPLVVGGPGGWLAGWAERIAEWFGWGDEQEVRPAVAAAKGDCSGVIGPDGHCSPPPVMTTDGDCSGILDPTGAPCRP